MAINPPTDIVLDVARAADPVQYRQAVARLGNARAGEAFGTMLASAGAGTRPVDGSAPKPGAAAAGDTEAARRAETYRRFEAMALTSMLESTMTGDAASYFGKGIAGDTWKSLLVEQIADQISKSGGIGIAVQLARSAGLAAPSTPDGPAARSLIVNNLERGLLRTLEPEKPTS